MNEKIEILDEIDNIAEVSNFINQNFELYGQSLDDSETLTNYIPKFEKAYNFRTKYNDIRTRISEKEITSDLIELYDNASDAIWRLDVAVVNWYMKQNTSKIERKADEISTSISLDVRNVPIEFIEKLLKQRVEKGDFTPLYKESDNDEYCYTIYCFAPNESVKGNVKKIHDFRDELFNNMLKNPEIRNEMCGDYLAELIDRKNKATGREKCKLEENFKPRTWQIEAYDEWTNETNNGHGTVGVATGAGKTLFSLYCLEKQLKKKRDIVTIIVVPNIALMGNWYLTLIKDFGVHKEDIIRRGGKYAKSKFSDKKFVIYVGKTAQKELAKLTVAYQQLNEKFNKEIIQFHILDECHHYATEKYLQMFEGLNQLEFNEKHGVDYFSIGLSATPTRADNREELFYNVIGPVIYRYSIVEALADDVVSPFTIKNVHTLLNKRETKKYKQISHKIKGLEQILFTTIREAGEFVVDEVVPPSINFSKSSATYAAFEIVKYNPNILKKLSAQKSNYAKKYEENANEKLNKYMSRKNNTGMKIVYTANKLVAAVNKRKELLMSCNKRIKKCIRLAIKHQNDKVIIFSEYIEGANYIYSELVSKLGKDKVKRYYSLSKNEIGSKTKSKSQRDSENKEALESFKNGNANIIVTVKSFDEGVDVPNANIGIIFQSTKGERQAIQRLGRIIRKNTNVTSIIPKLYFLYHRDFQKPFLKEYFQNHDKLFIGKNNLSYEDIINKSKQGIEKIEFKPKDLYEL